MLIQWIEIAMLGFGLGLSTAYFLRSCYLKRRSAKKIDLLQTSIDKGFLLMSYKMEILDRELQVLVNDVNCLTIRTAVVETRMEERISHKVCSSGERTPSLEVVTPKRGRPRKKIIQ